ncbi:hypothetical protein BJ742DRAFT_234415 [Cladochytrium replicatum]|nr:hypothetical protein BJ742DRAFT_234415 [Cladochytrium replicatum]
MDLLISGGVSAVVLGIFLLERRDHRVLTSAVEFNGQSSLENGAYVWVNGIAVPATNSQALEVGIARDVKAVITEETTSIHVSRWSAFWNYWVDSENQVARVLRGIPFVLIPNPENLAAKMASAKGGAGGSIASEVVAGVGLQSTPIVLVPELASNPTELDLTTISDTYAPSGTATVGQFALDMLTGERQLGVRTVFRALPVGSQVTILGQLNRIPPTPSPIAAPVLPVPTTISFPITDVPTVPTDLPSIPEPTAIAADATTAVTTVAVAAPTATAVAPLPMVSRPIKSEMPFIITRKSYSDLIRESAFSARVWWWVFCASVSVFGFFVGRRAYRYYKQQWVARRVKELRDAKKVDPNSKSGSTTGLNSNTDGIPESEICSICLSRRRDTLLLECSHFFFCNECSLQLTNCPVCRAHIVRRVKMYI